MTTKILLEKMNSDEVLSKKLSECKSPEEAYAAAKEAGLTDDFDTFTTVMSAVNMRLKEELSDEELDNIAGGLSEEGQNNILVGTIFGACAATAAAAA
ncbi:MAG: Nif11-like leader peptide family RiPP precursor [Oscillospiraceae bacterium]